MEGVKGKQEKLFLEEKVWKAIFSMAIPAMVTMLVMIFYNMADMFFVAQMGDNAQVAAVSFIGPVFSMIMAIGSMLGGGACVLIAKTLGERNYEHAKLYSSLCCWGSLFFGIIIIVLILVFRVPLLGFLGVNEDIWNYANQYLVIIALGAPVMIFTTGIGGVIRAEGSMKESMTGNVIATVFNIILDPLLILVLGMGVGGAALATVLANVIGAIYYILYFKKGKSVNTLQIKYAKKRPWDIYKIITIGLPNAISTILVGFASAFANKLLVRYGTDTVAAMAAAGKATMVISMLQMGITMGVQPMIAYCYGAKNIKRLNETIKKLSLLTVSIGVALTIFCLLNGKAIVSIFLQEGESLTLAQSMIHTLVLSGPILGVYYLGSVFLQASGNATLATIVSVLRQGVFLVPLLYFMNYFFHVRGNIYAHVIADYVATALTVILAVYQYKKVKKEEERNRNYDI